MKSFFLLLFILCVNIKYSINANSSIFDKFGFGNDPDFYLNVTQLITSKGYPAEEYTAQTKDGYLLGMQRIPFGRKKSNIPQYNHHTKIPEKQVVLLLHGLLSSSTDWVLNFPDQSLGFILADAGYDVWLGNIRGNTYSRRHVKFSPDSKEFWDFSFDEMGQFDLPAMIDLVLNITGKKNLFFIGHSQGTSAGFSMLSTLPEYNKKVKLFAALAPVTSVGHMTSAVRYLAPFTNDVDFLLELLGVNEFLPGSPMVRYWTELMCDTPIKFLCENVIFLLCGTDHSQLNTTRLGVYVSHTPAGASTKSIIHYAQMVNSKKFQKYDHGKKGNLVHYNQTTPPEYHTENIFANVALFWSKNDKLADPEDVHALSGKLKTLVYSDLIKLPDWNHLDFIWGVNANTYVYKDLQILLNKFSYNYYETL